MDPISISIEFEVGAFLLGVAGLIATWLHNSRQKEQLDQRERHHQENLAAATGNETPAVITTAQ